MQQVKGNDSGGLGWPATTLPDVAAEQGTATGCIWNVALLMMCLCVCVLYSVSCLCVVYVPRRPPGVLHTTCACHSSLARGVGGCIHVQQTGFIGECSATA